MDVILMMDNQRDILNKNINSLKETMDLISKRIQILEDQIKINDKINKDNDDKEIKEIMKEDIKEVITNTNEKKKRGRKPKNEGGNEWAAELNKAEPDIKKKKPKHENKNFSYYKYSYTPEQREKCKERSRQRYYRLKALKGEGIKKRNEEPIKKRGRPKKQ